MFKKSSQTHGEATRFTALVVVFVFSLTSVVWTTPVQAATTDVVASSVLSLDSLKIPAEIGTVNRVYRGNQTEDEGWSQTEGHPSSAFVVLIQDAHAVIDAQENIAKILGHLGKVYGIRLTALEGAKGRLEPILFRTFPEPIVKKNILAGYESRGELSGAEIASALQEDATDFRGMEDWTLYEQNYFAYLRAQGKKDALLKRWGGFKEKLDKERAKVYDDRLNEFQEARESFLAERSSLLDLLVYLSNFKPLLNSGAYKELPGLIDSMGCEKAGKSEALVPLVRKIADEFKVKYLRGLGVKTEMNFYNRYQAFMTGQITAGQMILYLVQLGRETGKNIKLTPALKKLLGHAELLSEIRGSALYEELQRFLPEAETSLIKTPEQGKVAEAYGRLFLLREMIELELTHEALAKYQKEPDAYLNFPGDPQFREDLVPALEFYQAALERDQAFLVRINAMIAASKQSHVAVVAGGFHTNGIERILKDKGISYAVVTPKIASLTGIENYAKVMKGDISFKDDLKATYFDALMRHASKALIDALPVPDRVRTLEAWRDNLIRELAKQGRITEAGKYLPYIDELLQSMPEMVSAAGSRRGKEETLELVRAELQKFKKDSQERIWKAFELQLGVFVGGLKQLVSQKDLNARSVSALLDQAAQTQSSFAALQCKLEENTVPIFKLLGESSVDRRTLAAAVANIQAPTGQIVNALGTGAGVSPSGVIAATAAGLIAQGERFERAAPEIKSVDPEALDQALDQVASAVMPDAPRQEVRTAIAEAMSAQLPGSIPGELTGRAEIRSTITSQAAAGEQRSEMRDTVGSPETNEQTDVRTKALPDMGGVMVSARSLKDMIPQARDAIRAAVAGNHYEGRDDFSEILIIMVPGNSEQDFTLIIAPRFPREDNGVGTFHEELVDQAGFAAIKDQIIQASFDFTPQARLDEIYLIPSTKGLRTDAGGFIDVAAKIPEIEQFAAFFYDVFREIGYTAQELDQIKLTLDRSVQEAFGGPGVTFSRLANRSETRVEFEKILGTMRSFARNERFAGTTVRIYPEQKDGLFEWAVKASDTNIFHFVMRENLTGQLMGYYQRFELDRQSSAERAQGGIHAVGGSKAFGQHQFLAGRRDQSMDLLHFSVRPGKDAKGTFVNIEVESKERGVEVRWEGKSEPVATKELETASRRATPVDEQETAETVETLEVTNRHAFDPELYTLDGITRLPRTISVDVPAFRVRNGQIEQSPEYHNPSLEGDEAFSEIVKALEKEVASLNPQDRAVLAQEANGWILGDDAVSDWITHAVHLLNERNYAKRDFGLGDFIRQYLKDCLHYLKISGQEQARFAGEIAKNYRYFSRMQLLREKPQSKFSVLQKTDYKKLRLVPERDPRTLSPNVMAVEPTIYQFEKGRRFKGGEIPPEKLVFAKWKGRTFLFYTSRTHSVAGVTQRMWRYTESYWTIPMQGGWLVKHMNEPFPENVDDVPAELGRMLDDFLDNPEVAVVQSQNAFKMRASELGLLNFGLIDSGWNELARIFAARSSEEVRRIFAKISGASIMDKLTGKKMNPQFPQARDYMLGQFKKADRDDEIPTQDFSDPETQTRDVSTRSELRGAFFRIASRFAAPALAAVMFAQAAVAYYRSAQGTRTIDPREYRIEVVDLRHGEVDGIYLANANPFRMDDGKEVPTGWVRSNGRDLGPFNPNSRGWAMAKGIFIVGRNGQAAIIPTERFNPAKYPAEDWPHGFQAGPMIVTDGVLNPNLSSWYTGMSSGRRVIIGVDREGRVHVLDLFDLDMFGKTGPTKAGFMRRVKEWMEKEEIVDSLATDGGHIGPGVGQDRPPIALFARSELREGNEKGAYYEEERIGSTANEKKIETGEIETFLDDRRVTVSASDGTAYEFKWYGWDSTGNKVRVEAFVAGDPEPVGFFDFTLGEQVATAEYSHNHFDPDRDVPDFAIWVDEKYRSPKIGPALLQLGYALAKDRGMTSFEFRHVESGAVSFYEKNSAVKKIASGRSVWATDLSAVTPAIPELGPRSEARSAVFEKTAEPAAVWIKRIGRRRLAAEEATVAKFLNANWDERPELLAKLPSAARAVLAPFELEESGPPLSGGPVVEALTRSRTLVKVDGEPARRFLQAVQLSQLEGHPTLPFTMMDLSKNSQDGKPPAIFFREVRDLLPGRNVTQVLAVNASEISEADVTEFYFVNGVYAGYGVTMIDARDLSALDMQFHIFKRTSDPEIGSGKRDDLASTIFNMRLGSWQKLLPAGISSRVFVGKSQYPHIEIPTFYLNFGFKEVMLNEDGSPDYSQGIAGMLSPARTDVVPAATPAVKRSESRSRSEAREAELIEGLSLDALAGYEDPFNRIVSIVRQYRSIAKPQRYADFRVRVRDALAAYPPASEILAIVGLSGSGKTTATRNLLNAHPDKFVRLKRTTTRQPRDDDLVRDVAGVPVLRDGRSVYNHSYLSEAQFIDEWRNGFIFARRDNHGYHYGYILEDVLDALVEGKTIVMEALRSALELKRIWPQAAIRVAAVFPMPYEGETDAEYKAKVAKLLRDRIVARGGKITEEEIQRRLDESGNIEEMIKHADFRLPSWFPEYRDKLNPDFERFALSRVRANPELAGLKRAELRDGDITGKEALEKLKKSDIKTVGILMPDESRLGVQAIEIPLLVRTLLREASGIKIGVMTRYPELVEQLGDPRVKAYHPDRSGGVWNETRFFDLLLAGKSTPASAPDDSEENYADEDDDGFSFHPDYNYRWNFEDEYLRPDRRKTYPEAFRDMLSGNGFDVPAEGSPVLERKDILKNTIFVNPHGRAQRSSIWELGKNWVEVITGLIKDGKTVILSAGEEINRKEADQIEKAVRARLNAKQQSALRIGTYDDLGELLKELSRMEAIVTIDTGVYHVARNFAVPTVVVSGGEASRDWIPSTEAFSMAVPHEDFSFGSVRSALSELGLTRSEMRSVSIFARVRAMLDAPPYKRFLQFSISEKIKVFRILARMFIEKNWLSDDVHRQFPKGWFNAAYETCGALLSVLGNIQDPAKRILLIDKFLEVASRIPEFGKRFSGSAYNAFGVLFSVLGNVQDPAERILLIDKFLEVASRIPKFAEEASESAYNGFAAFLFELGNIQAPAEREKAFEVAFRIPEFAKDNSGYAYNRFGALLPVLGNIQDPAERKKAFEVASRIPEFAKENSGSTYRVFDALVTALPLTPKNLDKIEQDLTKILELTRGYNKNIEAIAELSDFLKRFPRAWGGLVKPVIWRHTVGAFWVLEQINVLWKMDAIRSDADSVFLRELSDSLGTRAYDIFKNFLVPVVSDGTIAKPLSSEQNLILDFLKGNRYVFPEMFVAYKKDPRKLGALTDRCRKIHRDIVAGDASKWENDPLFGMVLFMVFPPEATTERKVYLELYRNRPDRPADTENIRKGLQVSEPFALAAGNYTLKDPSKPLNEAPWQTLLAIVREANGSEVRPMPAEETIQLGKDLLEHWRKGDVYQARQDLMMRLYRYFRSARGLSLPSSLAGIDDIMAHKEFIGNTLRDLAEECVQQFAKQDSKGYHAVLGKMFKTRVDNPRQAAKAVWGMLEKNRSTPDQARANFGKILRIEDEDLLGRLWNELRDKKDAAEVAVFLGSLEFKPQEGKEAFVIAAQLQGGEYKAMESELSQKYEFTEGAAVQRFRFVLTKRKAHGVAGFNMGVCVTPDKKLWDNPNFMNVIIFDEHDVAWGGMHALVIKQDGKKYLTLPGINPSSRLLTRVASDAIYERMMEYAEELAKHLGCEAVLIPKSLAIHSNRQDIKRVIADKNYHDFPLKKIHPFSYSPHAYSFQETYLVADLSRSELRSREGVSEKRLFPGDVRMISGSVEEVTKRLGKHLKKWRGGRVVIDIQIEVEERFDLSKETIIRVVASPEKSLFLGLLPVYSNHRDLAERATDRKFFRRNKGYWRAILDFSKDKKKKNIKGVFPDETADSWKEYVRESLSGKPGEPGEHRLEVQRQIDTMMTQIVDRMIEAAGENPSAWENETQMGRSKLRERPEGQAGLTEVRPGEVAEDGRSEVRFSEMPAEADTIETFLDDRRVTLSAAVKAKFADQGYKIVREMGRGARGIVYQAVDQNSGDRPVAIKIGQYDMGPEDFEDLGGEFDVAGNNQVLIGHKIPGVIQYYGAGVIKGIDFLGTPTDFPFEVLEFMDITQSPLLMDSYDDLREKGLEHALGRLLELHATLSEVSKVLPGFVYFDISDGHIFVRPDGRWILGDLNIEKSNEIILNSRNHTFTNLIEEVLKAVAPDHGKVWMVYEQLDFMVKDGRGKSDKELEKTWGKIREILTDLKSEARAVSFDPEHFSTLNLLDIDSLRTPAGVMPASVTEEHDGIVKWLGELSQKGIDLKNAVFINFDAHPDTDTWDYGQHEGNWMPRIKPHVGRAVWVRGVGRDIDMRGMGEDLQAYDAIYGGTNGGSIVENIAGLGNDVAGPAIITLDLDFLASPYERAVSLAELEERIGAFVETVFNAGIQPAAFHISISKKYLAKIRDYLDIPPSMVPRPDDKIVQMLGQAMARNGVTFENTGKKRSEAREDRRVDSQSRSGTLGSADSSVKARLRDFRMRLKRLGPLPEDVLYPNFDVSYQMVMDGLVPVLSAGYSIVEIGTGTGVMTDLLASAGRNVSGLHFTATDKNPAAVRIARKMLQGFGNVEVWEGNLFDPVAGKKFDIIFWNPPWFDAPWGGKEQGADRVDPGYAAVQKFLLDAPGYLKPAGRVYVLFPVKYFQQAAGQVPFRYALKNSYVNGKGLEIGLFEYDPMLSRRGGFSESPKLKRTAGKEGDPAERRSESRSESRMKETNVRDMESIFGKGIAAWLEKNQNVAWSDADRETAVAAQIQRREFEDMIRSQDVIEARDILRMMVGLNVQPGTASLHMFLRDLRKRLREAGRESSAKKIPLVMLSVKDYVTFITALSSAFMREFLASGEFRNMPPSARLMAIVRQMEKEGIHLDSRHLTAIYSALPQNIAPGLSRKDISAADISIQVFEQVERALEDSKVQQFIRGALIREWPKEDRLNALYEFMKNVPIDPGTADLSQLYAVLPSELPGGISKNEIGYVNLSSQAYGELRSALQNPEVQDYLMNSGFMLRPVRVACAGLIAKILELGLPLSSRDPAGIATGLPAELRWQQTEKGVLSRATSMRSESRIAPGLLSSVDANDIVQETQRKGPDAARTMLEQSGRSELGRISSTFDDGSADLIAVLKEAPSMPSALPEAVAQLSGRLGNNAKLFDWPTLQASLENILMPKAMAETVNADVANIVPARMKLLMDTLANAKGSLTIGLDLSTGQDAGISAAVLEQLLKTIGERSGIVNELAVSGKLPGPARQALKSKGVNDRPMRPNQSFIPINTQTAVPLILNSRAANGVIHEVFYPIVGDRGTVTDTLVNDYANLLEVVAAIHCADIISRQPDLLKKPDLLKAELLKTLFRQEQGAVENLVQVRAGGRGFTISSAAVKVYLEMMAKQSIEQAA